MVNPSQHNIKIEIDATSGGALTDYSDQIQDLSGWESSLAVNAFHTHGSRNEKVPTPGGRSLTPLTGNVVLSTGTTELYGMLHEWWQEEPPVARTVRVSDPDDSTSGAHQFTQEMYLTRLGRINGRAGSGEVQLVPFELKPAGGEPTKAEVV